MHVAAIYDLADDRQDRAGALADALGSTVFEALSRLRSPGSGPLVVGVFAEQEQATRLAGRIESHGFRALVLTSAEIEAEAARRIVRRFSLNAEALQAESADGGSFSVAYQDVDLILRGMGISSSTSVETTRKRSLSLGAAVLSGGLQMTKTSKTTREVTKEEREGFLTLYAGAGTVLAFHENGLVYDALGPARGLTRSANFVQLAAELRRRCSRARYDERLLNRAGLAALLGPSLSPEENLIVATALLAKALRGEPSLSGSGL
jgi:hypothetical protein